MGKMTKPCHQPTRSPSGSEVLRSLGTTKSRTTSSSMWSTKPRSTPLPLSVTRTCKKLNEIWRSCQGLSQRQRSHFVTLKKMGNSKTSSSLCAKSRSFEQLFACQCLAADSSAASKRDGDSATQLRNALESALCFGEY